MNTKLGNTENGSKKYTLSRSGLSPDISSRETFGENLNTTLTKQSLSLKPVSLIWNDIYQEMTERKDYPAHPIGLKPIDDIIWGLHKREVMVIGGRPSTGKSAFAVHIVRHLADTHKRIVYFSLEMSREQLLERFFCNFCRVDNIQLRQGKAKDEIIKKHKAFEVWIKDLKLLIDDQHGYDFNKLLEVCDLIKPDFIVVDYIQMISSRGYRNKLDAIEEYVRKIKQLTMDINMGAIILSQINRSGVDSPDMSKLKGAGVLEEHPDTVATLKWDWENDKYQVYIEKQRHGEVKKVDLKFLPQYSAFEEIPIIQKKYEDDWRNA